mmetsp:Transcript_11067/g.17714  ORF Transcript_11067/g.17714 Transcript_11067/m.17714 type:complete len:189 (-) Transcript_11067:306-872(-)
MLQRTGEDTAAQLIAQGETMRKAIDDLEDQEDMLDEADFSIQRLEMGCCWQLFCCCCCCCQPDHKSWRDELPPATDGGTDPFAEPLIQMSNNPRGDRAPSTSRGQGGASLGKGNEGKHGLTEEEEFDRRIDSKLDRIGGALGKLSSLAGDMGAELQFQSKVLIPELDTRVETSKERTRALNKRTRKLL